MSPDTRIDVDDVSTWPDISLTVDEAKAAPSISGHGLCTNGYTAFWPGTPCLHCGKFVGRDGHFNVEHFEMSSEIASMDAECATCMGLLVDAERWNAAHPIGTRVRYWTGLREGDGVESVTRSRASVLGGHTVVVWVDGQGACIALSHVEAVA